MEFTAARRSNNMEFELPKKKLVYDPEFVENFGIGLEKGSNYFGIGESALQSRNQDGDKFNN